MVCMFACENAIDDWCNMTELESEKWGPALRNRLEGEAPVFKRLLDREELRQPNGRGIEYFKRTLRPHFVNGAQTVFLYRFMRFMKNNRGNGDLMKWMTRFQIDGRILEESWMDLCQGLDRNSPPIQTEIAARRAAHNNAQNALHAANDAHDSSWVLRLPHNIGILNSHREATKCHIPKFGDIPKLWNVTFCCFPVSIQNANVVRQSEHP